MMRKPEYILLRLVALALLSVPAFLQAEVSMPAVFSDHAVLQKSKTTAVWGKAAPAEKIKVNLGEAVAETTADSAGKWKIELDLSQAGATPGILVVQGSNRVEIKDVLVGEVWICSGQSNMEFLLEKSIDAEKEIPASANPLLREFKVKSASNVEPLENLEGQWLIAGPGTAGNFSAVGYYFGKKIQSSLSVPVGLICSSVGGTPSEAWTSYPALSTDSDLKSATDRDILYSQEYTEKRKAYVEAYRAWENKYQRQDKVNPEVVQTMANFQDNNGWKHVMVPMKEVTPELSSPGAIWLLRSFDVAVPDPKGLNLLLGNPEGFDTVYWNGQKLDQRTYENFRGEDEERACMVPAKLIKPGKNILAVRIFNAWAAPRLVGKVSQAGEWFAKMEFSLPAMNDEEKAALPPGLRIPRSPKHTGSLLFNAMIAPLIPYEIAGVVWYQGENNAERAWQYRKAFPLLINDWRSRWGRGDIPFYFCQLANYNAKVKIPGESDWAELREAQSSALSLPNTGQAVLIDIGEAGDIHPRNKKDAGERLAAIALAQKYGKTLPFSGPVYKSMNKEGAKIRILFDHAEGGLEAKALPETHWISSKGNQSEKLIPNSPGSQLEGFAICGADGKWVWAQATIDKESVVVESPDVAEPLAVRYGWSKNPTCNLYNGAGFPASPFRTDDFPAVTLKSKY